MMIAHVRGTKVNFVDENKVFLGYDLDSTCCENAGWFIDTSIKADPQEQDPEDPDLSEYVFDTRFSCEIQSGVLDGGAMVVFRLVTPRSKPERELFLHLYNVQNGFYSHGFIYTRDGKNLFGEGVRQSL